MSKDWEGSAVFGYLNDSDEKPTFRWRLDRWWRNGPRALVCGANPSYAGGDTNDPTITQTIKLVRALGYPGLTMINWSPYIATDPKDHLSWRRENALEAEAAGHRNYLLAADLAQHAAVVIVAWGNLVDPLDFLAQKMVTALSKGGRVPLHAFGKTKSGSPKHPMARGRNRLSIGEPLVVWHEARSEEAA